MKKNGSPMGSERQSEPAGALTEGTGVKADTRWDLRGASFEMVVGLLGY